MLELIDVLLINFIRTLPQNKNAIVHVLFRVLEQE